jgi:HEAT repeat protein
MGTQPSHPLAPRRVSGRESYEFDRAARLGGCDFRAFLIFLFRGSFSVRSISVFSFFCGSFPLLLLGTTASAQNLTPIETAVRTGTTEQKRDALFQIRNLKSEIASRTAIPALKDADPTVRATSASSVIFLPKLEALAALTPLLNDKDAFVRKEAAYALGNVESPDAATLLTELLRREKDLEVKAAVIVALGQTGNLATIEPLIAILKGSPKEDEEFIRRSAARSIGQIAQINKTGKESVVTPQNFLPEKFKELTGDDLTTQFPVSSAAVVTLNAILQNKGESDDTRREAAFALGAIGSRSSQLVLQAAANSPDPYLAEIAREALAKIALTNPVN